jgi:hypothetical protein
MEAPQVSRVSLIYGDGDEFRTARLAAWFLALKDLDRLFSGPDSISNIVLLKMKVWNELVLITLSRDYQRTGNRTVYWVTIDTDYGQRDVHDLVGIFGGLPEQKAGEFLIKLKVARFPQSPRDARIFFAGRGPSHFTMWLAFPLARSQHEGTLFKDSDDKKKVSRSLATSKHCLTCGNKGAVLQCSRCKVAWFYGKYCEWLGFDSHGIACSAYMNFLKAEV